MKELILPILLLINTSIFAQEKLFYVYDIENNRPVEAAHLWISHSESGSFTNDKGEVIINLPLANYALFCSHLAYATVQIDRPLSNDTIYLMPSSIDLSTLIVVAKKKGKHKRLLKRFEESLLGISPNGRKSSILNPEVVVLKQNGSHMHATAKDLIQIYNPLTGYNISLFLQHYESHNSKTSYSVQPFFKPIKPLPEAQLSARKLTYRGSFRHFIDALIQDQLKSEGFIVNFAKSNSNGIVEIIAPATRSRIIQETQQGYQLSAHSLIQIIYTLEKDNISDSNQFSGDLTQLGHKVEREMITQQSKNVVQDKPGQISYIFLPTNVAILDKMGRPTSAKTIVQLGYWNYEGVADFLPFEYELQTVPMRNGFALSNLLVPPDEIIDGGPGKDGIPAIDKPLFTPITQKDMTDHQRILGVYHNGIAKAYPINILDRHEVVNDIFGNENVTITYCPLCNSGVAYSTKDNFGVSGLLYNSDVLIYDRTTESLWSQILGKAISGKRSGHSLKIITSQITTLKNWEAKYPESFVLSVNTGYNIDYNNPAYRNYRETQDLMFPVINKNNALKNKEQVIGITIGQQSYAFTKSLLNDQGQILYTHNGNELKLELHDDILSVMLNGEPKDYIELYWFAWYAFHPDTLFIK